MIGMVEIKYKISNLNHLCLLIEKVESIAIRLNVEEMIITILSLRDLVANNGRINHLRTQMGCKLW